MTVVPFKESGVDGAIEAMARSFSRGEPAIVPTDTLYGLTAPASVRTAVMRIFTIKSRPIGMTLPIAVGDLDMLMSVSEVADMDRDLIRGSLPGPYTFVLRSKGMSDPLLVRDGTVAVRVPDHALFGPLTRRFGPMALTSANPHGGQDILRADDLDRTYCGELVIIEDDGSLRGTGSEIVDLTRGTPHVLRPGNLNKRTALGAKDG